MDYESRFETTNDRLDVIELKQQKQQVQLSYIENELKKYDGIIEEHYRIEIELGNLELLIQEQGKTIKEMALCLPINSSPSNTVQMSDGSVISIADSFVEIEKCLLSLRGLFHDLTNSIAEREGNDQRDISRADGEDRTVSLIDRELRTKFDLLAKTVFALSRREDEMTTIIESHGFTIKQIEDSFTEFVTSHEIEDFVDESIFNQLEEVVDAIDNRVIELGSKLEGLEEDILSLSIEQNLENFSDKVLQSFNAYADLLKREFDRKLNRLQETVDNSAPGSESLD